MSRYGYVWEKMHVAVGCLCETGPFYKRLESAAVSALVWLEEKDIDDDRELAEDLAFVLRWTKHNMAGGRLQRGIGGTTRRELVSKMLSLLAHSYERQWRRRSEPSSK